MVSSVSVLGAQWSLTKKGVLRDKETARMEATKDKLRRLEILHLHAATKTHAISVACLTASDFVVPPLCASLRPIRMCVKQALSATYAAPEILYHICGAVTIDPLDRWILTQSLIERCLSDAWHFGITQRNQKE